MSEQRQATAKLEIIGPLTQIEEYFPLRTFMYKLNEINERLTRLEERMDQLENKVNEIESNDYEFVVSSIKDK